jgi:hypothetical protein
MLPTHTPLDALPLWGVFVFTLVLVLAAVEMGYLMGRSRHARVAGEKEGPVGAMVGSTLGLLALMLGFTFSFAANRFDVRRTVLIDETNAIGTTYLRADMLPEPHRAEIRALLREYTDARLEGVRRNDLAKVLERSNEIQQKLWAHAVALGRESPNSIVVGLFIQTLNETIDIHAKRLLIVTRTRIPTPIWATLYLIAIVSLLGLGYQSGLSETSRSPAVFMIAIAFSLVICLVADMDRPQEGAIKLSQQSMIDLQTMMHADKD